VIDGPIPVPAALDGDRVDRALSFMTGWPRASVQHLIDDGAVLVDGRVVAKSHRLHEGNVLEVLAEPPLDSDARPEPEPAVDVEVRFADDDVVVVSKPAGLVVHPGAGHAGETLVNGLLARFPDVAGIGDAYRPGIVHRLDRDTSGLLVVARSPRAYESLVGQISDRTVDRRYVALVWGALSSPRGVIDAPIGRSTARRTRMAVRASGKVARTEYEVRTAFAEPRCSLLDCRLETGRTHQIRVHLSAIGHPVVGDATYGGSRAPIDLDRPFLHATHLAFDHPATGERLAFDDPLPESLAVVLAHLA
jgi:23S rRNA pseudouridine1911/1915/1917 synthase